MAHALYRKYRSQTFDELIGQEHITNILKNAVKSQNIAHAYLFVGSRGTGKTSTARILAKAINCQDIQKDGNPCNKCEHCTEITNGNYLDLIEIDAASNRGIDQIRELKEKMEFSPVEGKFKIYIIDEVHMLTNEAFNALLKTLEEPPEHVIFILATTEAHKLPPTIVSRCQRYDFRLGSNEEIEDVIKKSSKEEGIKISEGALKLLVESARGSYRDALSILDVVISGQIGSANPQEISEEEVRRILGIPDSTMVYYFLESLVYGNRTSALNLIQEIESKGVNLQQFTKQTLVMLREILVAKLIGNFSEMEYSFAKDLTPKDIVDMINIFINVERSIKSFSIPALVLEMVIPQIFFEGITNNNHDNCDSPKSKSGNKEKKGQNQDLSTNQNKASSSEGDKKLDKSDTKVIHAEASDDSEKSSIKSDNKKANKTEKNQESVQSAVSTEKIAIDGKVSDGTNEEHSNKKSKKISISLEDIIAKWKEVTNTIKAANGHLFAFLEMAKLVSFEGGKLTMEVPYDFHKERIECLKSREAILEVFQNIYGVTFPYECTVNTSIKPEFVFHEDVVVEQSVKKSSTEDNKTTNTPNNGNGGSQYNNNKYGNGGNYNSNNGGGKSYGGSNRKQIEEIFAGL